MIRAQGACGMDDANFRDPFQDWTRERDAIEHEMNLIFSPGRGFSSEHRQARQTQFAALIERRNVAMHNLLQSDRSMIGATRDRATNTMQLPPSSPISVETHAGTLPDQCTEHTACAHEDESKIGVISESHFRNLGPVPSTPGAEAETLCGETAGSHEGNSDEPFRVKPKVAEIETAPPGVPPLQPRMIRAISARLLPLWRVPRGQAEFTARWLA